MKIKGDVGIGIRVARYREIAGLSQQDLADAVGVSRPYITMIENGARAVTKRTTFDALVAALGLTGNMLTGQPLEPITRSDLEKYRVIPQIRAALVEPDDDVIVTARPLDQLEQAADRAMAARMNCDMVDLGRYLPDLLSETRMLWFEHGDRAAGILLVKAAVTGSLALKAAGHIDLGLRLAELADTVAASLGDPVCIGAAQFTVAQAALATGHRRRSGRLAIAGAETLDRLTRTKLAPKMMNDVYAWMGVLHLHAALSVAALDGGDPGVHLDVATTAARHVTGDPWRMEFSGANVGVWRVGVALENGHADQAPALARLVDPNALVTKQRKSRLELDRGRGLFITGDHAGAIRAFLAADRAAPGDLRSRPTAVEIVAQMVRDAPIHGGSAELHDLAVRVMGIDPLSPPES